MAPNRFMTDLDFTKTQIAVYFVVLLLAVDDMNPVHICCHAIPNLQQWHLAVLALILLIYVILSELKQVLYFAVKIFFHSILSIFFREVEVVGLENIPRFGPVLFTINHANQFIDATAVLSTCQHKISYLMAEASFKRRVIGDIAWAMDVVPVRRAQDEARKGTGRIRFCLVASGEKDGEDNTTETPVQDISMSHETDAETKSANAAEAKAPSSLTTKALERIQVQGSDGSKFVSELAPGDKIRPPGTAFAFKVVHVESDTVVWVDGTGRPDDYQFSNPDGDDDNDNKNDLQPTPFDILKKVDTHVVFEKVLDRLASGGAVGIFPEGGSHDRTELLPLKVGIALIAYSALDKKNLLIPIVPVGLNYFRAHRWRGKAVIEYGRPTMIDPSTLKQYQAGGAARRQVCNALLEDIERSMKSVIVSAPDYDTLQLIHTARRLWQRKKGPLDTAEKQDLTRRFAQGYQLLLQTPNPPPEWKELQDRILDYRDALKDLGIRDYQVPALTEEHMEQEISMETLEKNPNQVLHILHLTYQILHLLFLVCVAAIPFLLINFPVGVLAGWYAERRRKRALAKSKVKIKGYDVMLTEKVVFCIVAVPSLWVFYAFVLSTLTDMDGPTIALLIFCLPLFAYMGIVAAEGGMVDWKDLRPLMMRLNPSARKRLAGLPKERKLLQDDLRAFIKEVGPKYLGDLYYKEKVDWTALWEKEKFSGTPKSSMGVDEDNTPDPTKEEEVPTLAQVGQEKMGEEAKKDQ